MRDVTEFNDKISRIKIEEYIQPEALQLDSNYFMHLELLAFFKNDINALHEYKKLLEIKALNEEEKKQLLLEDDNGELGILKYKLTPHSYIYVLSHYLNFENINKLFELEEFDGKIDFKIRRLGIDDSEIVRLLKDIRCEKLRNALLLEKIKDENGEDMNVISLLLTNIEDIKNVLCNPIDINEQIVGNVINGDYGNFGSELVDIVLASSDIKVIEKILSDEVLFKDRQQLREEIGKKVLVIKELIDENGIVKEEKDIKLLPGMTVGIEFEMVGPTSNYFYRKLLGDFKGKKDITIKDKFYGGVEIVSPLLTNDNLHHALYIGEKAAESGEFVNKSCGGHVHLGADYLTVRNSNGNVDIIASKLAWKNFLEIWESCENILYKICNKEGEEHRGIAYAKPSSGKIRKIFDANVININDSSGLKEMLNKIREIQIEDEPIVSEKFFVLNLSNLNKPNKNTVEFRGGNATLEKEELKDKIKLYTALFAISKELGILESKKIRNNDLDETEEFILNLKNEIVNDKEIEERAKFEKLINLLFVKEKDREVYRKKYIKSNFDLAKECEKLYGKKEYDYTKYGEEISSSDESKLKELHRKQRDEKYNEENQQNIKYSEKDFKELALSCWQRIPLMFQRVNLMLRKFAKQLVNRREIKNEDKDVNR